jgi:hypothetical protein
MGSSKWSPVQRMIMKFSIENNYSPLNNYSYKEKSGLSSFLDWLSKPCRRVLGGRNVYVLSQTYESKPSTSSRVTTVAFLLLFSPIAVVSIAGLLVKMATLPWIWEQRKIKVQSGQAWGLINQFNEAFQKNKYDQAIQIVRLNPHLRERKEVDENVFKCINLKINNGSSWDEVQTDLRLLSINDAILLIDYAIKMKLSNEFKNDRNITSADHIISFIKKSLSCPSLSNIESCYKKLFSSALRIDTNGNVILNAIKMDISDHLIRHLCQLKKSHAQNELERATILLEGTSLRYEIFDKDQQYFNYFLMFSLPESMEKISTVIQNVRNINRIGWQSLDKLNTLVKQSNTNQPEQWNAVRSEFVKFKENLARLSLSADEGEKAYIRTLQAIYDHMINYIDSIKNAPSVEEIETLTKNLESSLGEQAEKIQGLFTNVEVSPFQTNLENFLSTLRLKWKADLLTFTEKMKSILMTSMTQAAISMLQNAA